MLQLAKYTCFSLTVLMLIQKVYRCKKDFYFMNWGEQNKNSKRTQKSCFCFAYLSSHDAPNHPETKSKPAFPWPKVSAAALAQVCSCVVQLYM